MSLYFCITSGFILGLILLVFISDWKTWMPSLKVKKINKKSDEKV